MREGHRAAAWGFPCSARSSQLMWPACGGATARQSCWPGQLCETFWKHKLIGSVARSCIPDRGKVVSEITFDGSLALEKGSGRAKDSS